MNKPLENLDLALQRLREALSIEVNDIVRDGAIQRFEFCFELSWKAVQQRVRVDGIDCASPRMCFQQAWRQGWIEETPALAMISDWNLISHTCDHALAVQVYSRLAAHCETMERLRVHLAQQPRPRLDLTRALVERGASRSAGADQ